MLELLINQLYKDVDAAAKKAKEYDLPDKDIIDLYNLYLKEAKLSDADNRLLKKLPDAGGDLSYAKLLILTGQLKTHVDSDL